jgi:preprotein translocase subunit YajC
MNFYALTLLQAQGSANGGGLTMLLMLALIFVVMWLFMIRPQQKRQKELNNFRNSLSKGDKVVTVGGIYGTVIEVNDNKVMLEIDKDVRIKVDKASLVKDFSDAQQS